MLIFSIVLIAFVCSVVHQLRDVKLVYDTQTLIIHFLALIIVIPVIEEIIFRLVMPAIIDHALSSSILFAMTHYTRGVSITYNSIAVVGAYVMGRYLYDISKVSGFISAVYTHILFNFLSYGISRSILYYYYNTHTTDTNVCVLSRDHPLYVAHINRIRETFASKFPPVTTEDN